MLEDVPGYRKSLSDYQLLTKSLPSFAQLYNISITSNDLL